MDDVCDETAVQQARLCEIGSVGVNDVVIDGPDIASRLDGVYCCNISQTVCTNGPVAAEEIVGEAHILQKAARNAEIKLAIGLASINKEINWKYSFCIDCEDARGEEVELRVRRDGILDASEFELPGDSDVVLSGTVFVSIFYKLNKRGQFKGNLVENIRHTWSNKVSLNS